MPAGECDTYLRLSLLRRASLRSRQYGGDAVPIIYYMFSDTANADATTRPSIKGNNVLERVYIHSHIT